MRTTIATVYRAVYRTDISGSMFITACGVDDDSQEKKI